MKLKETYNINKIKLLINEIENFKLSLKEKDYSMINKPSLDYTPLGIITTPTLHVGSRIKPSYYSSS